MDAGATGQPSQVKGGNPSSGPTDVDGQAAARGHPDDSGSLLRAAVSDRSHGFRPGRGCHTALSNVVDHWTGVRWFVEGDIKGCFDNIDHEVLLSVLGEKLHDNRFLRLLKYLLKAGYMEDWKHGRTLSGTPQGGVVSPILSNIYLDRLDKFVENVLIPANTRGTARRDNREYTRLRNRMVYHRNVGHHSLAAELRKQMQQLPSRDPHDPDYRRLRYVRYADDFVLGFIGPRAEAQQVKESWRRSCTTRSSWSYPGRKLSSPTPPARRRGSSATNS